MTTSINHPTPELLSESALAEIEARPSVKTEQWCLHRVLVTESERNALCATVRALEAALRKANGIVLDAAEKNARQQLDNTALRDQLAQADETNRLAGLQIVELEFRLAQVEKERDDLRAHVEERDSLLSEGL